MSRASADDSFGEDARKETQYSISLGAYFPTVGGGGSAKVGSLLSFGYRQSTGNFDFITSTIGQLRWLPGETFGVTDATGSHGTKEIFGDGFAALYRYKAFAAGPGISLATQSANTLFFPFSHPWRFLYTLTASYDINKTLYVEAFWQALGPDPYRGAALSVGARY